MSLSSKAGSQSTSRRNPSSRKDSKPKSESISKYFNSHKVQFSKNSNTDKVKSENLQLDTESPFKDAIKDFRISLSSSNNEDDDFQSPKPKKSHVLQWKIAQCPKQKQSSKRGKKKTTSNSTLKIIEDNFSNPGDNADQLQLAIALSKSSYELENSNNSQSKIEETPNVSNILSPIQHTKPSMLERYGFKSEKAILPVEIRKKTSESNAKSRFKFITPILEIRTKQERQAMIASKIAQILSENKTRIPTGPVYPCLISNILKSYIPKHASVFTYDNSEGNFYIEDFKLSKTNPKCGHLLKDWASIPGRDLSPSRSLNRLQLPDFTNEQKTDMDCVRSKHEETSSLRENPFIVVSNEIVQTLKTEEGSKEIDITENSSITTSPFNCSVAQSISKPYNSPLKCVSPDIFGSDDECSIEIANSFPKQLFTEFGALKDESENITVPCEDKLAKTKMDEKSVAIIDLTDDSDSSFDKSYIKPPNIYNLDEFEDNGETQLHDNDSNHTQDCKSHDNEDNNILRALCEKYSENDSSNNTKEISSALNANEHEEILNGSNETQKDVFNTSSNTYDSSPLNSSKCKKVFLDQDFISNSVELTESDSEIESSCLQINGEMITKNNVDTELYNSTELNVTGYVNNLLSQVNQTFSQSPNESGSYNVQEDAELALSHSSQSSILLDEELNYSSSLHTNAASDIHINKINHPVRITRENSSIKDPEIEPHLNLDHENESLYQIPNTNDFSKSPNSSHNDDSIENSPRCSRTIKAKRKRTNSSYSKFYDSAELNITDYVNNLLSQEAQEVNLSSKEISFSDKMSEKDVDLPLSQQSNTSILSDEELNYSSHVGVHWEGECIEPQHQKMKEGSPLKEFQTVISANSKRTVLQSFSTPTRVIVKTGNVTPMPNYDEMDTPTLIKKLSQFGIKSLKRTKGLKLLKYIYETTHPIIKCDQSPFKNAISEEENRIPKRLKLNDEYKQSTEPPIEIIGDKLLKNEKIEDLVFERKYSAKIHSCAVPLQIVWHNFLSINKEIRDNVLLYEPLQLEALHLLLKNQGYKFHIQDLLTFLDRKCITIRTAQGQTRRRR